jgi:hypothetical protein
MAVNRWLPAHCAAFEETAIEPPTREVGRDATGRNKTVTMQFVPSVVAVNKTVRTTCRQHHRFAPQTIDICIRYTRAVMLYFKQQCYTRLVDK